MITKTESVNGFAENIACLEWLYKKVINDINFFEILKIDQRETIHSNFLAWLLDPQSSSGIGEGLIKKFLTYCSKEQKGGKKLTSLKIEAMNFDDVVVKREFPAKIGTGKNPRFIDLFLYSEEEKFCICIENKIHSGESKNQLSDYRKYIEDSFARSESAKKNKWFDYKYRYYVLLSPNGNEAEHDEDRKDWIPLSYSILYDWISEIADSYKDVISSRAKDIIKDYMHSLQQHIIDGSFRRECNRIYTLYPGAFDAFEDYRGQEKKKLINPSTDEDSLKLYHKHKAAIDLVLDNKIGLAERIKLQLIYALRDSGQCVEYGEKVSALVKIPKEITLRSIVNPKLEDTSKDFLFYELYYEPGKSAFHLTLRCQPENVPKNATIDPAVNQYMNKKDRYVWGPTIGVVYIEGNPVKLEDYIKTIMEEQREPRKDDAYIKALCDDIIAKMTGEEAQGKYEEIRRGIHRIRKQKEPTTAI